MATKIKDMPEKNKAQRDTKAFLSKRAEAAGLNDEVSKAEVIAAEKNSNK